MNPANRDCARATRAPSLQGLASARHHACDARRRRVLTAALALAVPGWGAAAASAPADVVTWPRVRLIDGTELDPGYWQGRGALVVFWATWCGYCKRHNERLNRLLARRREAGPRVLMVAIDSEHGLVLRHVQAQGWNLPVALDEGRLRPVFTDQRTVPLTIVVGPQGQVRQRIPGEMTEDDLRELLLGLPA